MASTDATPLPIKGQAYRATFPILDNTGALVTDAAGLDSEVDKDAAGFSDCTNEATEIGSTGIYTLDLTSGEMNADTVTVLVKTSTTDARTTVLVIPTQSAGKVKVDVETIKTQTVTAAAGVTFPTSLASPTNITAGTIATVTNLTNLPTAPTDWLTAAAVTAAAVTKIQSGLSTLTQANVRTALGMATDNLDTQLAALPTDAENAAALLKFDMSTITGEAARSPINAFRFLRNKWSVAGTTLTVTKEDDTTSAWTGTVSTDASADPITGNSPS